MPSKAVIISKIEALGCVANKGAKYQDLVAQLRLLKQLSKVPHVPHFSEYPTTPRPDPSPRSPPKGSALSPRLCLITPKKWRFTTSQVAKEDTMEPMSPVTPQQSVLSFGAAMYLPVALTPATKGVLDGLDTIVDLGATPKSEIGDWKDTSVISDQECDDDYDFLTSSKKHLRLSPDSQISRTKSLDFSQ
jgi:hypothetical protein